MGSLERPRDPNRYTVSTALLLAALLLAPFVSTAPTRAAGPWRADGENTRGWQFMTPEERLAHQAKIRSFSSYAACHAYQLEHHAAMEERARQKGLVLAPERRDSCEHLKPPAGRSDTNR